MKACSAGLLLMMVIISGCSLITEPNPNALAKVCAPSPYTSQLNISFESVNIMPEYFSARVNGAVVVDECLTGLPNRYIFKRHNDFNATLTLFAIPDTIFSQLFFDQQGTPYNVGDLDAAIYARAACDADPVALAHVQKPIVWTPVYNNGQSCALGGYLGN